MKTALDKIERQMDDVDYSRFLTDVHIADSVAMQFLVLGEAANKLSEDLKSEHPEIAWRKIVGLRHLIAHEYEKLDPDRLWDLATEYAIALSAELPLPPPLDDD